MRRTGKTFRTLLKALNQASEGKHIIYQCSTHNMARWTFDKAEKIVSGFMEPDVHENMTLKIGQGTVRFTKSLSDIERGLVSGAGRYLLMDDLFLPGTGG